MYRKLKPLRDRKRLSIPDPDGFLAGGLLYFDPDNPAVFVQGPRTVALNAGNHRLLLGATYVIGLMLLITWASKAHAADGPEGAHAQRTQMTVSQIVESWPKVEP